MELQVSCLSTLGFRDTLVLLSGYTVLKPKRILAIQGYCGPLNVQSLKHITPLRK